MRAIPAIAIWLLAGCDPAAMNSAATDGSSADFAPLHGRDDLANAANSDLARAPDGGADGPAATMDLAAAMDLAPHVSLGAGSFAGHYLCQTMSTTTFNSPPSTTMSNGVDYVDAVDGTATDLVLQFQGGVIGACDLGANRSGSSATILAGQQCSTVSSGVTIVFTVGNGDATASPGTLIIDLAGTISGAMGMSNVDGSFTAQYQCVPQ